MTDYDPYQPDNVPLFEALYGKNLISLGGLSAIDYMFSDLNIKVLTALDLGFGLGGVAYYLAEQYQMNITGIEILSWMAEYATNHTPKNIQDLVKFDFYNPEEKLPYNPNTFDLVYSKGVLNHVANKERLFGQINEALKPNGLFVIADWLYPKPVTDDSGPLVCETEESYRKVLMKSNFNRIAFRDDSVLFLMYVRQLLENLADNQTFIKTEYGEDIYFEILKQHEELINELTQHNKIATRIIASKPAHN